MNPYEKKCVACGHVVSISTDFCPSCDAGGECGAFEVLQPLPEPVPVASEAPKAKRGKRAA